MIKLLIPILLFCSCSDTYRSEGGNIYKVVKTCVDDDGYYIMNNNSAMYISDCDSYKIDTVIAN